MQELRAQGIAMPDLAARPEPAEGACGQQGVDESIDDFFDDIAPRLTFPYSIAKVGQTVGEECSGAGNAKDDHVRRRVSDGMSRNVSYKDTDNQAIRKPHGQKFRHR